MNQKLINFAESGTGAIQLMAAKIAAITSDEPNKSLCWYSEYVSERLNHLEKWGHDISICSDYDGPFFSFAHATHQDQMMAKIEEATGVTSAMAYELVDDFGISPSDVIGLLGTIEVPKQWIKKQTKGNDLLNTMAIKAAHKNLSDRVFVHNGNAYSTDAHIMAIIENVEMNDFVWQKGKGVVEEIELLYEMGLAAAIPDQGPTTTHYRTVAQMIDVATKALIRDNWGSVNFGLGMGGGGWYKYEDGDTLAMPSRLLKLCKLMLNLGLDPYSSVTINVYYKNKAIHLGWGRDMRFLLMPCLSENVVIDI